MKEIWKVYKEYKIGNNTYKASDVLYVSNFGRCRINYDIVEPSDYRGYKKFSRNWVHRIVYELFVGKIPEGYEIDHIDTNPSNNRLDNLRCVTPKENQNNPLSIKKQVESHIGQIAWNKGIKMSDDFCKKIRETRWDSSGIKNPSAKAVLQIDKKTGNVIKKWEYMKLAANALNIDISSICKCCKGKLKSRGGYVWRYADI